MCFPMERVPWNSEKNDDGIQGQNKYATFRGVFVLLDIGCFRRSKLSWKPLCRLTSAVRYYYHYALARSCQRDDTWARYRAAAKLRQV